MSLRSRLGLKDDETLEAIVRRAPVTLVPAAVGVLLLIFAAFFFMTLFVRWETLGTILFWLLLGLGVLLGARMLVIWRLSVLVVTDRRLIVVRQKGFFDRRVLELPFPKIHEVSYQVKGIFATICRYGTLLIESAGSDEPIAMACVSDPAELQDLISQLQSEEKGGFGDILHSVSRMERSQLEMLRSEITRSLKAMDDADADES